jgi:phage tail protein X
VHSVAICPLATRAVDAATVRQQTLTKPSESLAITAAVFAGHHGMAARGAFLPHWHGYIIPGWCFQRRRDLVARPAIDYFIRTT